MTGETKNQDVVKELVSDLIKKLNVILDDKDSANLAASETDIILKEDDERYIKIDNKIFYQMIYTDVKKLKKDNEIILNQYLEEIRPTLKSVDENVKALHTNFKSVKTDVDYLMKNKPKTFKTWVSEKGQMAESTGNIFKFILYAIVILWILSTALPTIFHFISKLIGIETSMP